MYKDQAPLPGPNNPPIVSVNMQLGGREEVGGGRGEEAGRGRGEEACVSEGGGGGGPKGWGQGGGGEAV